jgi:nucleoside-diphosphate-sugar epimerase
VSINQIVENLRKIFGKIETKNEPVRPHDFKGTVVSIEKANRFLKWKPKTLFKDGLRNYVQSIPSA